MSEWEKVKIGDICRIVKGTTGIASAEPGQYPLVVTAEERKTCSTYQLCLHETGISNLLKIYPSYFTNVFQRLVNKHK
ncbi:MAG: hypothetical protein KIG91_02595 [Treponema sp.]|nr:hypothetical protein [Treponema sp.]